MSLDDWILVACGVGILGGGMCFVALLGGTARIGARLRRRPKGRHRN